MILVSAILPFRPSSEATTDPLFEVDHLSYSVKKKPILTDLSFVIHKGEKLVVLGENGTGKTTLLRLFSRLNKPSSGAIIQHIDPSFGKKKRGNKRWFKKVGAVYQNPDYQLFMSTVFDEVDFVSPTKEEMERLLKLFHLENLRERHPQSLSEGQKRKLSIAAVLASKPEVLFLDEPTVGQDYESLKELCEILEAYQGESGATLITITHDKRCALALGERAILLEAGKLKEEGGESLIRSYFGI